MIIRGRMLQNDVLKYLYMLRDLRVNGTLIPRTSATSIKYFRILLILYSISRKLRNIKRLKSLLRNLIFATRMSWNLRSSLTMGPLFKRLWVNTVTLLPQSGGNPLISKKSLKIILFLWMFPLGNWRFSNKECK